jgi:hypothetical protein
MDDTNRKLNKREIKFVLLFVFALLISFSPSTELGQVSALIFLLGTIFFVQVRPGYHIKKYLIIFLLYSAIGFVYWLIYQGDFSFINYYLFWVTGSAFLLLFYDFRSIISQILLERLGQITLVFIFLESLLGIYQATVVFLRTGTFDFSVGDFVWGTLAPSFNVAYAGRSPSFVLLITTLLLFTLATFRSRLSLKHIVAFGAILLAWLLSSLMHSYLYFGLAAGLALLTLTQANIKQTKRAEGTTRRRGISYGVLVIFAAIVFLLVLVPILLPSNTARIGIALGEAVQLSPDAKFLKNRAFYNTLFALPDDAPLQPIIGVGPGQYASRAALMATGQYLTRPIPGLPQHISSFTNEYIVPYLRVIRSSLHLPSSSWIALYGEMGLLGMILVIMVMAKGILFFRRYRSKQFRMLNLMMLILIYYLFFMGFQNVYLEYTQAIFPAILTLKLCYDFVSVEFDLRKKVRTIITNTHRRKVVW